MCVLGVFFFFFKFGVCILKGFPAGSVSSMPGRRPGLGRAPGEGNGNPLQYSCLGNPMDRGAWWDTVHGVAQSQI